MSETSEFEVFDLQVPILSSGRLDRVVAESDDIWISMKVYARGGENDLHQHPTEDHAFIVLEGEATFIDEHDRRTVLGRYEGVFLRKGLLYRFHSSGQDALVMLRVGGAGENPYRDRAAARRTAGDEPALGDMAKIAGDPVVETGRVFGTA